MDQLENFSTWCDINEAEKIDELEKKIKRSYEALREYCLTLKWQVAGLTVSTVTRDNNVIHILTAQLVSVAFLQRQRVQQSLSPNLPPNNPLHGV